MQTSCPPDSERISLLHCLRKILSYIVFEKFSLTFLGKNGEETSEFSLDKFFHNDFERGEIDTYDVSGDDVGDVAMITLKNSGFGLKSDWYIAKIIVKKETQFGEKIYEFPCYRWVVRDLVVYEGKGKTLCTICIKCKVRQNFGAHWPQNSHRVKLFKRKIKF